MTQPRYVTHDVLAFFAANKVNLPPDRVKAYREQSNRVRERLEKHITTHPDFALVKMLNSGSVAKGTALATSSDMDLAVYVRRAAAPEGDEELVYWLRDRLREAYTALDDDQFEPQHHCVTLKFRTASYADVDVVPVLYEGEADNVGTLIVKDTGARVVTSVSRHGDFVRARKGSSPSEWAQVIRLLKWWVAERKDRDPQLRFKSFLVELLCAHLKDNGTSFADYSAAMESFFSYIVTSRLSDRIGFEDYYSGADLPGPSDSPIEIFDPVNSENNIAASYTTADRDRIVSAAQDALEALADASYATTKNRSIEDWQEILGPTFRG
jgi:hypothetical protein